LAHCFTNLDNCCLIQEFFYLYFKMKKSNIAIESTYVLCAVS
jgi:hypothetical protein